MTIHVEGITVVIRKAAAQRLPRGVETFRSFVTNATFASDGHLLRAAFMDPSDVAAFVGRLEEHGLLYQINGIAVDICVADQVQGLMVDAPWLDSFEMNLHGNLLRCLASKGTDRKAPTFPVGWTYETSLYSGGIYVPEDMLGRMLPIMSDGGVDMVIDLNAGKPLYTSSAMDRSKDHRELPPHPAIELPSSPDELYAREEAAIEFARQALLRSGEPTVPLFAPPKRWLRAKLDRHQNYPRPEKKTIGDLANLYDLRWHPAVLSGMIGLLYGRAAGEWAGELYDALFLERRQRLNKENEDLENADYFDRPCISRVPVPSLFLKRIEEDLPPYDAVLELP